MLDSISTEKKIAPHGEAVTKIDMKPSEKRAASRLIDDFSIGEVVSVTSGFHGFSGITGKFEGNSRSF